MATAAAAGCLSIEETAPGNSSSASPPGTAPSNGTPVTIGSGLFARVLPGQTPMIPFDPQAKIGEKVVVVARDVGPFARGPEGKTEIRGELRVRAPNGSVVHTASRDRRTNLTSAPSVTLVWPTQGMEPGRYNATFTVTDAVTGANDSVRVTIPVTRQVERTQEFGAEGWAYSAGAGQQRRFMPGGRFPLGLRTYFALIEVGPFMEDDEGRYQPALHLVVRNETSDVVVDRRYDVEKQDAADAQGYYTVLGGFFELPTSYEPGNYTVSLRVEDEVTGNETDIVRDIKVTPPRGGR